MSLFDDPKRCGAFLEALVDGRQDVARLCAQLREHHEQTFLHGYRVALLSVAFGYENRVDECALSILACAGLLHDLGKSCVPLEIIDAPRALDENERRVMSAHPRLGFVLLEGFDDGVRKVVVAHHEYKLGQYPRSGSDRRVHELLPRTGSERRSADERTDSLAQMVAAADVYDALFSVRAYKEPLGEQDILRVMREQYIGDQKYVDQLFFKGNSDGVGVKDEN